MFIVDAEEFSSLFAAVVLPAAMGWQHVSPASFMEYVLVAGLAIAIGNRMTLGWLAGANWRAFLRFSGAQSAFITALGGPLYVLEMIAT